MRSTGDRAEGLRFSVVVKPRCESTSFGLQLVHDRAHLAHAVENILTTYDQDALVEEYIYDWEVCIALLGNERMEFREDKAHKVAFEPKKFCPSPLDGILVNTLREILPRYLPRLPRPGLRAH
jgi:D-alanine-D-alanine ligase